MNKQHGKIDALYTRLSRDDELYGDSSSIQTQKAMLSQFAKQNGLLNPEFFIDDGYSGTNFNRPDFQKLFGLIEKGLVRSITVKDLSRLGRDYLQTGMYIEQIFPDHDIRFIAIDDNVDSAKGENEFAPFKNIMNEWYARDVSKKVKGGYKIKASQGLFTGTYAPYGYKKNPDDKHKLILHEETASIVKKMFEMAAKGTSLYSIAKHLKSLEIKTPRVRIIEELDTYHSEEIMRYPYDWAPISVRKILLNRVYLGHMVAQKSTSKSYKNRKMVYRPESDWIEVRNTHEALVDEEIFIAVQRELSIKRRHKVNQAANLFVGKIKCADCGKSLHINFGHRHHNLSCATYKRHGISACSMHHILYKDVYDAVFRSIKEKARQICTDTQFFLDSLKKNFNLNSNAERSHMEKGIAKTEKRIAEINAVTKKLYEDSCLGKISEERFMILSGEYESEQKTLRERLAADRNVYVSMAEKTDNVDKFVRKITQYQDLQSLDGTVIAELIDKIIVHEAEYVDGKRTQKLDIYYNFIGIA
jgi:DNA invertase Pin-like site-specific DNA recombinase